MNQALNSSMVPNLNITVTEVDLILQEISSWNPIPLGLPAPSIRLTPIDGAAGKDMIFAMAFPTLYPTGRADFNAPRLRKVDLQDYVRHLMCSSDGRFGRHPRWRFLAFNISYASYLLALRRSLGVRGAKPPGSKIKHLAVQLQGEKGAVEGERRCRRCREKGEDAKSRGITLRQSEGEI